MSDRIRFALALAIAWALLLATVAAAFLLVAADMSGAEQAQLAPVLREHAPSVAVIALLAIVPLALILQALFRRYVTASRQLAEDVRIMLAANPSHRAPLRGAAEIRRLAEGVNGFAAANATLRHDVESRVREANERIEQERNRLAALMSELTQSVIVCNVEGRILLYNARAMQLLRQRQDSAAAAGKAHSLVGLGRSIFGIFDRNLIIHALDRIHDRLRQGTRGTDANFVTTTPAG